MRHSQDGADGNVGADSLQFIDFEYGCVSYRGFDWGNHFNEYAGFECDYGRYPDGQGAASFIRHYLAEAHGGREPVRGLRIMVQREASNHAKIMTCDVQRASGYISTAVEACEMPVGRSGSVLSLWSSCVNGVACGWQCRTRLKSTGR